MSLLAVKLRNAMDWSSAEYGHQWTARSLARAVDNGPSGLSVSHQYIGKLLSGEQKNPSLAAITAIADALRVPTVYFLPETPDDIEGVVWWASCEAQYALMLVRDMPEERRRDLTVMALRFRAADGLPEVPYPQPKDAAERPPEGQPARRWLGRRQRDPEPVDKVISRIIQDLQGPSPGGEEETAT